MLRAVGVVRKLDELGRIVIPIELRRTLDIEEKGPLEIFTNENGEIVLKKYQPGCEFCGSLENVKTFSSKNICQSCIDTLVMQNKGQSKASDTRMMSRTI